MPPHKSKDARKVLEYDITAYTKGFVAETVIDGSTVKEYFQFREIHQIIHHPDVGVEIVGYNGGRRVFYNDVVGESLILYDVLNVPLLAWMNSNLN